MFFVLLTILGFGVHSSQAQQSVKNRSVAPAYADDRSKIKSFLRLAGLGEHKAFIQSFKKAQIADVNTPLDGYKNTLLLAMIYNMRSHVGNKKEIVKFLLEQPTIDLNIASQQGTALIAAIREGIPTADLVELLVSAGARPTAEQKGMDRVSFYYGDNSKSTCGNAYSFIKLYNKFPVERPCPEFYYGAIERGLKSYEKRKSIYSETVHKEIAEQLQGVTVLTNLCMEYIVIPTLPESVEKLDKNSCSTTAACAIS